MRILAFLTLILLSACTMEEVQFNQGESFIKFYESGYGMDVLETQDQGYLLLSNTVIAFPDKETTLVKTDPFGNAVWIQKYNTATVGSSTVGRDIQPYQQGYVVVGDLINDQGVAMLALIVVDNVGNVVSVISPDFTSSGLGVINNADQNVHGYSMTVSTAGVYVVGTFEDSGGALGTILLNFDLSNGNVLWHQTTPPEYTDPVVSKSMQFTDDGHLVWAVSEETTFTKVFSANLTNQTISETALLQNFFYPELVRDNDLLLLVREQVGGSGSADSLNISVSEIDQSGGLVSNPQIQYSGIGGFPSATNAEGGLVVLGTIYPTPGNADFYLTKDQDRTQHIWDRAFGGERGEYGSVVIEASTGNFVFIGTADQDNIPRIVLIKTDATGNIQ